MTGWVGGDQEIPWMGKPSLGEIPKYLLSIYCIQCIKSQVETKDQPWSLERLGPNLAMWLSKSLYSPQTRP